jgi:hypothetical protein
MAGVRARLHLRLLDGLGHESQLAPARLAAGLERRLAAAPYLVVVECGEGGQQLGHGGAVAGSVAERVAAQSELLQRGQRGEVRLLAGAWAGVCIGG